jgi:hypothetical protein
MSVTIRGTDNSVSTPAFTGTDGDTGLYFPATNQVALATNGTIGLLVDETQSVRINGASASTADSKLNTQITSAGSLITLAELRNNDFTAGTKSFLRVRNAVSAGGTGSAYFGHGQDNNTYIIANNSGRGGDIVISGSLGTVTTPSQPNASLGAGAVQTSPGVIIWTAVHSNVGSCYNSGTGLFTAPVAGQYLAAVMAMTDASAVTLDINLQKNGASIDQLVPYQGGSTVPQYNQVSGMTIISLAAGDTINFRLNSGSIYGVPSGRHSSCIFRLMG